MAKRYKQLPGLQTWTLILNKMTTSRLFFSCLMLILASISFGQQNFHWEKVDSVKKTKSQIYSDTKLFIAEYWKSANNVIQNDDKEEGIILVKGAASYNSNFQMNLHTYWYSYTVKFLMKENKYKVVIENVNCTSATCAGNDWPLIEPTEDTSKKVGGMPAAKLAEMMASLKSDMQNIIDSYEIAIKKVSATKSDW